MEGVRRLADMVNKGSVFDAVYLQPELLTAVFHVLQRPFKLHSLNGHDPLPGSGLQILHADWGQPAEPCGPYHVVNSMWMLDDFTRVNGATRCVPGSHRIPGRITDHVADRLADHPDQVHLTGRAGSVAVFNGSLWHSSYVNRSDAPRRALHCAFIAREHPQQTNQREYLQARDGPTPVPAGALHPGCRGRPSVIGFFTIRCDRPATPTIQTAPATAPAIQPVPAIQTAPAPCPAPARSRFRGSRAQAWPSK